MLSLSFSNNETDREGRPRKKKSRWGDEKSKVIIPGVPTVLPKGLAPIQVEDFMLQVRLEEIGRKLRTGDVVPPENERLNSAPFFLIFFF